MFAFDPFVGLAGASGITFHDTGEEGNYFLDVVGLFNSVVARYDVTTTEQGLEATGAKLLIEENLEWLAFLSARTILRHQKQSCDPTLFLEEAPDAD